MSLVAVPGFAVKPAGRPILWPDPSFYGYSKSTASSITMNTMHTNVTSGDAPLAIHASASAVTASGTLTLSSKTIDPYMHLQHTWEATNNDDSAITSANEIIDPNSRLPVNMYTDQKGGEAAFIFHEPGTYKVNLTSRSANGTEQTGTATITVNAPTYDHKWVDPDNGNDANDGRDPHGFDLTNASYTESTGELTQTGFFASYDHDAATSQVYLTDNYNWIALFYDSAWNWHRIASKTNNNTIVLEDKIGADKTGVTSSDGPLATFDHDDVAANTAHHLKVGHIYDLTAAIDTEDLDGLRFMGWGGSGYYRLRSNFNGDMFNLTTPPSNSIGNRVNLHKGIFDGNGSGGYTSSQIGGSGGAVADSHKVSIVLERSIFLNTADTRNVNSLRIGSDSDINGDFLAWGSYFDNRTVAGEGKRDAILTNFTNADSHTAIVGCTFSTSQVDNDILHHLVYMSGDHSHRLRSYNDSLHHVDASYFFNENCGGSGAPDAQYSTFYRNRFRNCNWGIDGSSSNNDYATAVFTKTVIISNSFDGNDGLVNGGIFWASTTGAFIGHNVAINVSRNLYEPLNSHADNEFFIEGNLTYDCRVFHLISHELGDHEAVGNISHLTDTDAEMFSWNGSTIGSDSYFVENQGYAPNDTDGAIYADENVGNRTLAQLNAYTNHSGNTESNPGWTDPANGDFT